ncbi:hypothetical protein PoB_005133400, partial [Plakobranchus ocellatus]
MSMEERKGPEVWGIGECRRVNGTWRNCFIHCPLSRMFKHYCKRPEGHNFFDCVRPGYTYVRHDIMYSCIRSSRFSAKWEKSCIGCWKPYSEKSVCYYLWSVRDEPCRKHSCEPQLVGMEDSLGFWNTSITGCFHGKKCYPVGSEVTLNISNTCQRQKCIHKNDYLGFVHAAWGCFQGKKCYTLGSEVSTPTSNMCERKICLNRYGHIRFKRIAWGCEYGRSCYQVGSETILHPTESMCERRKCIDRGGSKELVQISG